MPTQPPPQPSAPAPSEKPAREGTLFHLLVERGWDAAVAYTADQRIYAMTSETVAGSLQPVLEELRQMRETMAGFATKEDWAGFATKEDLASFATKEDWAGFATKEDLAGFATKEDWAGFATKEDLAGFATKEDLVGFATKEDLVGFATKEDLARLEARLLKWMFGAMLAQTAVIVGFVVGVVPLLK